ncbi:MAG: hypothetical protein CBD02_04575 [Candidatus Pelagibacter sp. TMED142]|nr:MAG: hypothetical protein CBD02_04575 [Candidatus Pelagibacter sp. TMED142]
MIDILATSAAALLPVATDGVRAVINRLTGGAGANPANIEERIALQEADTARLNALAALEQTGETYKWVEAVRALQRPTAVVIVLGCYTGARFALDVMPDDLVTFASAVTFYLFGERTNMYARRYTQTRGR